MSIEVAIKSLNDVLKTGKGQKKISELLDDIEDIVFNDALERRMLDEFARIVVTLPKQPLVVRGISLLHPRDGVLPDTIDFLLSWIIDSIRNHTPKEMAIKALLQWFISGVHSGVILGEDLCHSYYLLLSLLIIPGFANELCHLLYYITEPNLITTYTFRRLLMVRFPKKNYCHSALLSLYIRLKPHLAEENYQITTYSNELELFPQMPPKLADCFLYAMNRHGLVINSKPCRYPNWRLQTIAYRRRKLGNIIYVSEMTPTEALREALSSEIYIGGTMFDSILMNSYGCIFLALANGKLLEYFDTYIEKELAANLPWVRLNKNEEFSKFLTNLLNLMNVYGQPLRAVDHFIKENLYTWNGLLHSKQIFGFISHIVATDYEEIFEDILKPLYLLNIKFKDREFSKLTLRCLSQCLINNIINLERKDRILTLKNQPKPQKDALPQLYYSYQHLCIFFVNAFEKNADILHEITDHFIRISSIIEGSEFKNILLPNNIAYKILINSDFMLVEKFCRIWTMQAHQYNLSNTSVSECHCNQIRDFYQILFKNILRTKMFENNEEFRSIDGKIFKLENVHECFRSRYNLSFYPLVRIDRDQKYHAKFNSELYTDMIREYCEYFTILTSNNNRM